jgi:L-rhamnose mutarotase
LDCFSAHRNGEIRQKAIEYNINLHFVPVGLTGDYQPLDVRVFGALKAIAKNAWHENYMIHRNKDQNKASAIEILLHPWNKITEKVIESSWTIFNVDLQKAKEEMNITEKDVLQCYQQIIAILSDSDLRSNFHSLEEF